MTHSSASVHHWDHDLGSPLVPLSLAITTRPMTRNTSSSLPLPQRCVSVNPFKGISIKFKSPCIASPWRPLVGIGETFFIVLRTAVRA